jgi:predicted alpha-1,2-mannosidase
VARRLGRLEDALKYRRRASHWKALWNPGLEDRGARGFIGPRRPDGSWVVPFDVTQAGSWPDFFYESNSWEYSLFVPHDVRALVAKCGGTEAFVKRLDTLFDAGFFNIGNEPGFFAPLLYLWVDRPDRSADRVRETLAKHFRIGRQGVPGNDDSGTMSAFYLFHAMGFYPNPGSDVYLVSGAPVFGRVTIRMESGRELVIARRGEGRYVRAATLDGRPLDRPWFRHAEIAGGAILELEMVNAPTSWGRGQPPPSLSDPVSRKGP